MGVKAATFDAPGKPLRIETVADPTAGDEDLIIAISACGICGSDLHYAQADGTRGMPPLPRGAVMGHEFAGTVLDVGRSVRAAWPNGTRVTALPTLGCGRCAACLAGAGSRCATGVPIGLGAAPGAYAEFLRVRAHPQELRVRAGRRAQTNRHPRGTARPGTRETRGAPTAPERRQRRNARPVRPGGADGTPHVEHGSGKLVAHHRAARQRRHPACSVGLRIVQIGSANPARGDCDDQILVTGRGIGDGFDPKGFSGCVERGSLHAHGVPLGARPALCGAGARSRRSANERARDTFRTEVSPCLFGP